MPLVEIGLTVTQNLGKAWTLESLSCHGAPVRYSYELIGIHKFSSNISYFISMCTELNLGAHKVAAYRRVKAKKVILSC